MLLHDFLELNEPELIERCRTRVARRRAPRPTEEELEHGIPLFLRQLIEMLESHLPSSSDVMISTATQHGDELQRTGFTVAQVIHDYGDLCQAITELAIEQGAPISASEFGALNLALDDAIAAAVTEHARQREERIGTEGTRQADLQLGYLAHELRNLLSTAMLSFEVLKRGDVAINGTTGALHERALRGLRSLVDSTLAEVRLSVGVDKEHVLLRDFVEEVEAAAVLEADALSIRLTVEPVEPGLAVHADRQILGAVLSNLLQNAFKFTRENHSEDVSLRVRRDGDLIFIEVEDECGGLPAEPEELLRPLVRRGTDRSGLGLGLAICQRGAEANGGTLHVRDNPGRGCVFAVGLEVAGTPAMVG